MGATSAAAAAATAAALLALATAATPTMAAGTGNLVLLNTSAGAYPSARCLDGSPGAYYFAPASASENSTKWVFSLQGGGECVDQASCVSRSHGGLGSSRNYPQQAGFGQFLDADPATNPDFSTWNHVLIQYCSGDLHMGSMDAPDDAAWGLQFSGHHIIAGVLHHLGVTKGLTHASTLVWSGDSAGGIGSFAHLDFVADTLPGVRVVGAPIGGFYFSNEFPYAGTSPPPAKYIPWDYASLAQYYSLWGGGGLVTPAAGSDKVAFVPVRCAAAGSPHASAPWSCLFANASYGTLQHRGGLGSVFFIEGQTDRVVMPLHDGLPDLWDSKTDPQCDDNTTGCPEDVVDYMHQWGSEMVKCMGQVVRSGGSIADGGDGVFNPACLIHTSFGSDRPLIGGRSYIAAFGDWLFGRNEAAGIHSVDTCGVMCNPTCKG